MRTTHFMYMLCYRVAPLALMLCACGTAPQGFEYRNGSQISDARIEGAIDLTQSLAPRAIGLNGWVLTVFDTQTELENYCDPEALGCMNPGSHLIGTSWPDDPKFNPASAAVIAHELGHVYYYNTTGDLDYAHEHSEWFDLAVPSSICSRVFDANRY